MAPNRIIISLFFITYIHLSLASQLNPFLQTTSSQNISPSHASESLDEFLANLADQDLQSASRRSSDEIVDDAKSSFRRRLPVDNSLPKSQLSSYTPESLDEFLAILADQDLQSASRRSDFGIMDDAKSASFRRRLQVDYSLLNSVLGQLSLEFSTAGVAPIESTQLGHTFRAIVGDTTIFSALAVGEIVITGEEISPGTEYHLTLEVTNLEFLAQVALTVSCISGFACGLFSPGANPTATIISTAASASSLTITQVVEGPDFDSLAPTQAYDKEATCSEKVFLDGIVFDVQNLGSFLGFSVDGLVEGSLNGADKQSALGPIKDALCEQLANITALINGFILDNPLTQLEALQGSPSESLDNALDREENLVVPEGTELVDLEDNLVSNLLFPEWTAQNNSLALGSETPIFQTFFGLFGVDIEDKNPIFALVDLLLGTNLTAPNPNLNPGRTEIDLLQLLIGFLSEEAVEPFLNLQLGLPGLGSFSLAVNGVGLGLGPFEESVLVEALGDQTLLLPIVLGNFSLRVDANLNASVNTSLLLEQEILFDLEEAFSLELDIFDLETVFAVFLALDISTLFDLQIGPLFDNILDCLLSIFLEFPAVTAAVFRFTSIRVFLSGFQDAIGGILGDAVNAAMPVYSGLISRGAAALVQNLLTDLDVPLPSCPTLTPGNASLDEPYHFPSSPLQGLAGLVSEELVNGLLEGLLSGNESDASASLQLLSSPFEASAILGSSQLDFAVTGVALGGALPPTFDKVELLNASDLSGFFPQGLVTNVSLPDALSVEVSLQLALTQKGSTLTNAVLLNVSLASIDLVLELFAALSIFDVEATPLGQVLSLDCWTAELEPFGGIKTSTLLLSDLSISLSCISCQTPELQSLADVLSQAGPSGELGQLITDGLDSLVGRLPEPYLPENFNATVANAAENCANGAASVVFETKPDLGESYAFIGAFAAAIAVAGVASYRKLVVYSDDRKMQKSDADENLEKLPLYNHPSVPLWARIGIPLVLMVNFVMFLLGHVQIVIATDLVAEVAGIVLALENFGGEWKWNGFKMLLLGFVSIIIGCIYNIYYVCICVYKDNL